MSHKALISVTGLVLAKKVLHISTPLLVPAAFVMAWWTLGNHRVGDYSNMYNHHSKHSYYGPHDYGGEALLIPGNETLVIHHKHKAKTRNPRCDKVDMSDNKANVPAYGGVPFVDYTPNLK